MFRRLHPGLLFFGGSVLLFVGLMALLRGSGAGQQPLYVYCAEALRQSMTEIQQDYQRETGQKIDLHFGASHTILANLELSKEGDLFIPADDSFIALARDRGMVAETLPLARMTAVLVTRPDFPRKITSFSDLLDDKLRLGLGNTQATAIGKLTRAHLETLGKWDSLAARKPQFLTNVNEVANAALLGAIDAGVVWKTTAHTLPKLPVIHLPELDGVAARVQIALTKVSRQPDAALQFARYIRAPGKGARHLINQGFAVDEAPSASARREFVVHAGASLLRNPAWDVKK